MPATLGVDRGGERHALWRSCGGSNTPACSGYYGAECVAALRRSSDYGRRGRVGGEPVGEQPAGLLVCLLARMGEVGGGVAEEPRQPSSLDRVTVALLDLRHPARIGPLTCSGRPPTGGRVPAPR